MLDLWNPQEVRRELTFASCLLPIHEHCGAGEEEEKRKRRREEWREGVGGRRKERERGGNSHYSCPLAIYCLLAPKLSGYLDYILEHFSAAQSDTELGWWWYWEVMVT